MAARRPEYSGVLVLPGHVLPRRGEMKRPAQSPDSAQAGHVKTPASG